MDIEREADKWVRRAGGAKGEYPAYSERYLLQKDRRRHIVQMSLIRETAQDAPAMGLIGGALLEGRSWSELLKRLTPRQQRIMCMIREGCTLKVIASIIGCSERTVRRERQRILRVILEHPLWGLWEILAQLDFQPPAWALQISSRW